MEDHQFTIYEKMNKAFNFEAMKEFLDESDLYYAVCVDTSGNFTYINDRYAEKFNYISDDLIGESIDMMIHPDDAELFQEVSGRCYALPGQLFPVTIRVANGTLGYVITEWELCLMTENGFPTGVFCMGHEVATYEQVKNKFFIVDTDLEAKKEILGAIAYEQSQIVRSPLANILGLINVLKHYNLDPEAEVIVNMLQESTTLMDEIIKSIVKKNGQ
jgi:PAS domain S-box-containing protein